MSTDYEEFVEYMKEKDSKPSEEPQISVGMKNSKGSLLILGGHKANLWMLTSGLYAVGGDKTVLPEEAIKNYNLYNSTNLPVNYISEVFIPWYEKQFTIVANVPSRSNPNVSYTVRRSPSGKLSCECPGFTYRHSCWHVEAVEELISEGQ